MFHKDEFMKYATKNLGMSSMHLERYAEKTAPVMAPNIQAFTPNVIEERQMNIVGLDVFSRLMMDRIIFMGVPVNDYVANVIQAQLLFLESTDPKRDVQMFINSPGGSVIAGLGIYDTMQFIKPDVATICTGMAASMGAVLLCAGAEGKRSGLPHSRVMIHQPLGGVQGQATDRPRSIEPDTGHRIPRRALDGWNLGDDPQHGYIIRHSVRSRNRLKQIQLSRKHVCLYRPYSRCPLRALGRSAMQLACYDFLHSLKATLEGIPQILF